MKISVFGLGYVGCVSAACLAELGHEVVGVDVNPSKVEMVNKGRSPVVESAVDSLIRKVVMDGRLRAIGEVGEAVANTDLALVCVGTPSQANGSIDTRYVMKVVGEIGHFLRQRNDYFVIVIRSTVLPGTVEQMIIPSLEREVGTTAGSTWGICMNPEFLREGSSVDDFYNPPSIVIGELDKKSGDVVAAIYERISAPLFRTPIAVAEMLKYSNNAFHAVKVTFANEIGRICKALNVDSHRVMELFCKDTRLNISPAYFKPGFAFGGSCLGKDLRAIIHCSQTLDVETPLLRGVLESNGHHLKNVIALLSRHKDQRIGFLGLSFKGGTDDLRESPIVDVVEALIGKGMVVRIFDRFVNLSRLTGANKEYIDREIPHLARILCEKPEEILDTCEVIVVANIDQEFKALIGKTTAEQTVIDLVRITEEWSSLDAEYEGICW